jgi:hypothetical protein
MLTDEGEACRGSHVRRDISRVHVDVDADELAGGGDAGELRLALELIDPEFPFRTLGFDNHCSYE